MGFNQDWEFSIESALVGSSIIDMAEVAEMANTSLMVERSELDFIHAGLRTGLTMCRIARQATNRDKKERNRINARKAYDTTLRFMSKLNIPGRDDTELGAKLAELKRDLEVLGEAFGPQSALTRGRTGQANGRSSELLSRHNPWLPDF